MARMYPEDTAKAARQAARISAYYELKRALLDSGMEEETAMELLRQMMREREAEKRRVLSKMRDQTFLG